MRVVQQLEGLEAQVAEEKVKLSHLQEEADSQREEEQAAQKHTQSAHKSLQVLEEKYSVAHSALQELRLQLCEVLCPFLPCCGLSRDTLFAASG